MNQWLQIGSVAELDVMYLDETYLDALQKFLNYSSDFFLLCEWEEPKAMALLQACPPTRSKIKDKVCLGFFKEGKMIVLLDFIMDYPQESIITIGYLLVHPQYRSQKIGSKIIDSLSSAAKDQGYSKLRLAIQAQNPKALQFWKQNNFIIIKQVQEKLGTKLNLINILELEI